jgi:hypothetical protein
MIAAWVFWLNFWLAVMAEPPERHTAQIYRLDDYRDNKPNGRAA